jgi:hypothetical protein
MPYDLREPFNFNSTWRRVARYRFGLNGADRRGRLFAAKSGQWGCEAGMQLADVSVIR